MTVTERIVTLQNPAPCVHTALETLLTRSANRPAVIGVVVSLIVSVATVANATGSEAPRVVGGGTELEVESTAVVDLSVLIMLEIVIGVVDVALTVVDDGSVLIVFDLLLESIIDVVTGVVDIAVTVVDDCAFVVSLTLVEATMTCVGGGPQRNVPHEESPLKQYPA